MARASHANHASSSDYGAYAGSGCVIDPNLGDAIDPGGEQSCGSNEYHRLTLRRKEEWGVLVLHEPFAP